MASTLHTQNFPQLASYAEAAKFWEAQAIKYPRIAKNSNELPLGTPGQKACWIVKEGDAYAVKYHRTRVITFHKDGTLTLRPWASRNTELLVNTVMDRTLYVVYDGPTLGAADVIVPNPQGRVSRVYGRYHDSVTGEAIVYAIRPSVSRIALHLEDGCWTITDDAQLQAITIPTVNRKVSKARYAEYRLDEFGLFCKAAKELGARVRTTPTTAGILRNAPERLAAVRDRDRWAELSLQHGVEQLRLDVLRTHPECFDISSHMCLDAAEYSRAISARKRYPWV